MRLKAHWATYEPYRHKASASKATESQSSPVSEIDTTESEVLIIEAARLLSFVGEADRIEIDRALNTLDICRAVSDDFDFALSVLRSVTEDAASHLSGKRERAAA